MVGGALTRRPAIAPPHRSFFFNFILKILYQQSPLLLLFTDPILVFWNSASKTLDLQNALSTKLFTNTSQTKKRSYKRHGPEGNKRNNALPLLDRRKTLERVTENFDLNSYKLRSVHCGPFSSSFYFFSDCMVWSIVALWCLIRVCVVVRNEKITMMMLLCLSFEQVARKFSCVHDVHLMFMSFLLIF